MGNCCSRNEISLVESFENEKIIILEIIKEIFNLLDFEQVENSPILEAFFLFLNVILKNPRIVQPNINIFNQFRLYFNNFKKELVVLKENNNKEEIFINIRNFINKINDYFPKFNFKKDQIIISNSFEDFLNNLKQISPRNSEISGLEFWLKIETSLKEADFKLFLEKFNASLYNCNNEKSNILFLYHLVCPNNDFKVKFQDWDKFYRKIWLNINIRNQEFFSKLENLNNKFQNHHHKTLKLTQNTENNENNKPIYEFEPISIEKNLIFEPITIGSTNNSYIKINNNENYDLLEIFYKYDNFLNDQALESDFYMNILKKEKIFYLVDEKGFVLTENMHININGSYMKIKNIHPKIPIYSDLDYNYLETRPKNTNAIQENIETNENFIEFEFYKNGPNHQNQNYKFSNSSSNEYEITFGTSSKSNVVFAQKSVERHHCKIIFNSIKKCWVIKDVTYNNQKIPYYKTFVYGKQNIYIKKEIRPQKLMNGMKIFSGLNPIFMIEIK